MKILNNYITFTVDRTSDAVALSDANSLPARGWYFIIATYSSTDGPRIYVNGAEVSYYSRQIGSGDEALDAAEFLLIGKHYKESTSNCFNGNIDEVRIYNRALTADEILQLYQLGSRKLEVKK